MEKLNLIELEQKELQELNGGWVQVLIGAFIIDSLINYDAASAAFSAGYANATR